MYGKITRTAEMVISWHASDPDLPPEILSVSIDGHEYRLDGFSALSKWIKDMTRAHSAQALDEKTPRSEPPRGARTEQQRQGV